ncbi:Dyp-type peroxidase [Brachybacterium sp. MASK1Z-5]|uniref:Dyp-type peroxidase n=1 Tax=Brachybacterium halotolerans TaxID=2795215 RepID=A0ABS1BCA1_9MICO|nr:Dyp-type peroxidase [Brachybacterium halotolerans]
MPQRILRPLTESAIFLVLTVDEGGEDGVREVLDGFTGTLRTVRSRIVAADLGCVVGIGARAWSRLFSGPAPKGLRTFPALSGTVHDAPSTPGDLLFHIRAHRMDVCFELAGQLMRQLRPFTTVQDEVHGFRYFDSRDVIGFVDGTENPEGLEAQRFVVLDEDTDPVFVGGSYVTVQKYVHDMEGWERLTVEHQADAIGRHKWDNVEMDDETKPADSHTALTVIEDADGTQLKIVRDNMPFGSAAADEFGTYFIGYSRDLDVTEQMLRNMFLGDPEGTNHDRLLDFSTALTGTHFFVPTVDFLDDIPPAPGDAGDGAEGAGGAEVDDGADGAEGDDGAEVPSSATPAPPDPAEGSLGIGALEPTAPHTAASHCPAPLAPAAHDPAPHDPGTAGTKEMP